MRKYMHLLPLISIILLSSCADTKAIKQFADDTQSLVGNISTIVKDTPETCLRRLSNDIVIRNINENDAAKAKSVCEEISKSAVAINDLNKITAAYAKALSALSDEKFSSYASEIGTVKSSVAALKDDADKPYVDKNKLEATSSLADFILKIFTESYRQREIAKLLDKHEDLEKHAALFKVFIEKGYLQFLKNEEGNLESLTEDLDRLYGKTEPLRVRELKRDFSTYKKQLAEKRKSSESTVAALDTMISVHKKLRDNSKNLSATELLSVLDTYSAAVKDVQKKLDNAFK